MVWFTIRLTLPGCKRVNVEKTNTVSPENNYHSSQQNNHFERLKQVMKKKMENNE